ncbi:hypothetical protein D9619_010376 [Psilocybe cf. subviscida]|uniref:General transcription and DNA repair factor IIH subunit TFB5 n=1 Tax=Psilocybe cf. subviscida TaxID=2480587 RepID=A0A8H5ATZ6_9AGAR|nr:hypothetical protein D9619_010376 [Psilocybe cf. subviscida]
MRAIRGVLLTCDPAVKQILLMMNERESFIIEDLDDHHVVIKAEQEYRVRKELETELEKNTGSLLTMTLHNANENWFIGKDLGSSSLGLYNSTQPTKFCAQCPAARPIYQPQFSVFLLASYGGTSSVGNPTIDSKVLATRHRALFPPACVYSGPLFSFSTSFFSNGLPLVYDL